MLVSSSRGWLKRVLIVIANENSYCHCCDGCVCVARHRDKPFFGGTSGEYEGGGCICLGLWAGATKLEKNGRSVPRAWARLHFLPVAAERLERLPGDERLFTPTAAIHYQPRVHHVNCK